MQCDASSWWDMRRFGSKVRVSEFKNRPLNQNHVQHLTEIRAHDVSPRRPQRLNLLALSPVCTSTETRSIHVV